MPRDLEPLPADLAQPAATAVAAPAGLRDLAPPPAPREQPGRALSFGRGAVQGATLNFGDEIEGLVQALGRKYLPESLGGGGEADARRPLNELRKEGTAVARRENQEAEAAHPGYTLAGNLVGGIAPSVVAGGAWAGAPAYGAAEKLAKAAKLGTMAAGLGGASALGASEAPDAVGLAKDTLKGAGLGLGLAAAAPAVAAGAGKLIRVVKDGVVQMVPEAQYLATKGVRSLTLGQMNPRGFVNSLEQAAESVPIMGDVIKKQRQAGREAWQQAVLSEARPPKDAMPLIGGAVPKSGDVGARLAAIADDFNTAYEPIRKVPITAQVPLPSGNTAPLGDVLAAVAHDPGIRAPDDVRKGVAAFLENAYSEVVKSAANGKQITAGDLISVRSAIRSEIRQELAGAQPDYKAAKLLQLGADTITHTLEAQLPAATPAQGAGRMLGGGKPLDYAQMLRDTDAQYSKLMRVADAVRRGGDMPNGFTPAQLSAAVKASTEKMNYAKGGGGELRLLAKAGRETLDSTVPPTGARLVHLAAGVPVVKNLTVGLAGLGTTDFGKALLTGTTRGQRAIDPYLEALIKGLRSGSQNPYLAGAASEEAGHLIGGHQ